MSWKYIFEFGIFPAESKEPVGRIFVGANEANLIVKAADRVKEKLNNENAFKDFGAENGRLRYRQRFIDFDSPQKPYIIWDASELMRDLASENKISDYFEKFSLATEAKNNWNEAFYQPKSLNQLKLSLAAHPQQLWVASVHPEKNSFAKG